MQQQAPRLLLAEQVDVKRPAEGERRRGYVVRPVEVRVLRPVDTTTPADCPAARGDGIGPSTE